jgi:transcriptional regulator with XRE-family HTH domain
MCAQRLSVQLRALRHAVDIAGGTRELSAKLGVAHRTVLRWLEGADIPPASFLRVLGLILRKYKPRR